MPNSIPLVFVSHSHSEMNLALKLTNELRDGFLGGVEFFVSSDEQSIEIGDEWLHRIRESLTEACIVIVLVSPDSVNRTWVNFEAGAGWLGKRVIPVCHPSLSPNRLPQPLASLQGVDICKPDHIRRLFTVVGKAANLRAPDKNWQRLSDELRQVCVDTLGAPDGAANSWVFPTSEDSRTRDAMMQALTRCREARLCGTGLNLLWQVTSLQSLEKRVRSGDLRLYICLGNQNSPHIKQRIRDEPEHLHGIESWGNLIARLVRLKGEISDPNRLNIRLFSHYPTYAMLIFDDEFFMYPYRYNELGNLSPCFYWRGGGHVSNVYRQQFDLIFAESTPAFEHSSGIET